jgi:nucleoid-associated protein YgaU
MALSVKAALLTSLGFIFGMSWLVSQVARPIVELPTPLVARGPAGGGEVDAFLTAGVGAARDRRRGGAVAAGRFERSSVLEAVARRAGRGEAALVVAQGLTPAAGSSEPELPPLQVPDAPPVALVEDALEQPAIAVGAGSSVLTMTQVPEAIVASVPSAGTRLLAALRPPADTVEDSDVVGGEDGAALLWRQYTVEPGDSLLKILRRELSRDDPESLNVLLAANPEVAKRRDRIYPGEVLNIPDLSRAPATLMKTEDNFSTQPESPSRQVHAFRWYTIRKRDSLVGIARRQLHDAERWREIAELNRLRNAHKILPGTRIKLPVVETDA